MSKKLNVDDVVRFVSNGRTSQEVAANFGVTKTHAARFMANLSERNAVEKIESRHRPDKAPGRPEFVYRAPIKAIAINGVSATVATASNTTSNTPVAKNDMPVPSAPVMPTAGSIRRLVSQGLHVKVLADGTLDVS